MGTESRDDRPETLPHQLRRLAGEGAGLALRERAFWVPVVWYAVGVVLTEAIDASYGLIWRYTGIRPDSVACMPVFGLASGLTTATGVACPLWFALGTGRLFHRCMLASSAALISFAYLHRDPTLTGVACALLQFFAVAGLYGLVRARFGFRCVHPRFARASAEAFSVSLAELLRVTAVVASCAALLRWRYGGLHVGRDHWSDFIDGADFGLALSWCLVLSFGVLGFAAFCAAAGASRGDGWVRFLVAVLFVAAMSTAFTFWVHKVIFPAGAVRVLVYALFEGLGCVAAYYSLVAALRWAGYRFTWGLAEG